MKNCKTFYEAQSANCFEEIVHPPTVPPTLLPPPLPHTPRLPDKSFLRLWNKTFFTVIYKKIQTFAFKVFRECSENAWASRNGVVQMFFLTPTRNMFAGKFVKGERLLPVLREYIFFNVE